MTGERISALVGIGETAQPRQEKNAKLLPGVEPPGRDATVSELLRPDVEPVPIPEKAPEPEPPAVEKSFEWAL